MSETINERPNGPIYTRLPESVLSGLAALGSINPKMQDRFAIAQAWFSDAASSSQQVSTCFGAGDALRKFSDAMKLLALHAEEIGRSRSSARLRFEANNGKVDERLVLLDTVTGSLYNGEGIGLDYRGQPTTARLANLAGYKQPTQGLKL